MTWLGWGDRTPSGIASLHPTHVIVRNQEALPVHGLSFYQNYLGASLSRGGNEPQVWAWAEPYRAVETL